MMCAKCYECIITLDFNCSFLKKNQFLEFYNDIISYVKLLLFLDQF